MDTETYLAELRKCVTAVFESMAEQHCVPLDVLRSRVTTPDVAQVRAMALLEIWETTGAPWSHMSLVTGFGETSIRRAIKRVRDPNAPPPEKRSAAPKLYAANEGAPLWTKEKTEKLRELWAEGHEFTVIAKLLGVTRNAVVGKVTRLGLRRRPKDRPSTKRAVTLRAINGATSTPKPKAAQSGDAATLIKNAKAIAEISTGCKDPYKSKAESFLPIEGSTPRPWTERTFGQCAWPVEVVGAEEQHSCCEPRDGDRPYCAHHRSIAGYPPQKSANELARSLRRYA